MLVFFEYLDAITTHRKIAKERRKFMRLLQKIHKDPVLSEEARKKIKVIIDDLSEKNETW